MGPLIDAPSLARRLAEVAVLDVRWRLSGPPTYPDFLAGHIPGARWADLAAEFADPPGAGGRPLERFAAFDVKPGSAVGAYCGSGVTAAHTVLALALAGIPAALYPGSWSEWITDPGRAVATGPAPG